MHKQNLTFILIIISLTLSSYEDSISQNSIEQAENGYIFSSILKRAPSARSEAMARTSLSEKGNTVSIFLNPAGTASIKNKSFFCYYGYQLLYTI